MCEESKAEAPKASSPLWMQNLQQRCIEEIETALLQRAKTVLDMPYLLGYYFVMKGRGVQGLLRLFDHMGLIVTKRVEALLPKGEGEERPFGTSALEVSAAIRAAVDRIVTHQPQLAVFDSLHYGNREAGVEIVTDLVRRKSWPFCRYDTSDRQQVDCISSSRSIRCSRPVRKLEADVQAVEKQIGRYPDGMLKVLKYNSLQQPQVVLVAPIVWSRPFPTIYWLTDPRLSKAISDVEKTGWIKRMETNVIPQDAKLQFDLLMDNIRYIKRRLSILLAKTDLLYDFGRQPHFHSMVMSLIRKGIAGIANFADIRCLHMHYALHLVEVEEGGGCIGRILDNEYHVQKFV